MTKEYIMGKKKQRQKYVSGGVGRNVSASTLSGMRKSVMGWEKQFNILRAWKKGQNPWITIANPNKNEPGKLFIRVRLSALKGGSYKELEKKAYAV